MLYWLLGVRVRVVNISTEVYSKHLRLFLGKDLLTFTHLSKSFDPSPYVGRILNSLEVSRVRLRNRGEEESFLPRQLLYLLSVIVMYVWLQNKRWLNQIDFEYAV